MKAKRLLSMGLAAAVCVGTLGLAGCGSKGSDSAENTFSWWLYTDDAPGRTTILSRTIHRCSG